MHDPYIEDWIAYCGHCRSDAIAFDPHAHRCLRHPLRAGGSSGCVSKPKEPETRSERLRGVNPSLFAHSAAMSWQRPNIGVA